MPVIVAMIVAMIMIMGGVVMAMIVPKIGIVMAMIVVIMIGVIVRHTVIL